MITMAVIGSWSFPGWYKKFITDVNQRPDLFSPVDREEGVRDEVRLAIDDQLPRALTGSPTARCSGSILILML